MSEPVAPSYAAARLFCRIVFRVLGRWRIEDRELVPATGPVLLAANHISALDPPMLGAVGPRQVFFMAKEELFQVPALRSFVTAMGAFPVKRGTADRAALRRALELLEQGRVVGIFPEGTRSETGELRPAEGGAALLALKSRAPVVPARIWGTHRMLPPGSPLLRPARIGIRFGPPVDLSDLYGPRAGRDRLDQAGERIMAAIARLDVPA